MRNKLESGPWWFALKSQFLSLAIFSRLIFRLRFLNDCRDNYNIVCWWGKKRSLDWKYLLLVLIDCDRLFTNSKLTKNNHSREKKRRTSWTSLYYSHKLSIPTSKWYLANQYSATEIQRVDFPKSESDRRYHLIQIHKQLLRAGELRNRLGTFGNSMLGELAGEN